MFAANDLYPGIEPYQQGRLPVGHGHDLYWEQVGTPRAPALLFLHGGPGAGCGSVHRRFFDPAAWRVVLFDQRGAGRSTPLGCVEHNTTGHLIEDIEALRQHLGIESWVVFGGSWGSTLALAYAQHCPDRVRALVLRGIFLGREAEIAWFLQGLAGIFPDAHDAFAAHVPPDERHDLLGAYVRRLFGDDLVAQVAAARAWCTYEARCSTLLPPRTEIVEQAPATSLLALARIEAHYFRHHLYLPPDGVLGGMARIAHVPGVIVQGRYDMICPTTSAWELSRAWPAGRLRIVPGAGHSALEPGIRSALVAAVHQFSAG